MIHELDARRLLCPLPVIRTQSAMQKMNAGDVLKISCTDPGVLHDIPTWCRIHGHEVIDIQQQAREIIIQVMKK